MGLCRIRIKVQGPIGMLLCKCAGLLGPHTDVPVLKVRVRQTRIEEGIVADNLQAFFNEAHGLVESRFSELLNLAARPQVAIVSLYIRKWSFGNLLIFGRGQLQPECLYDGTRHLLLHLEHVVERAAVLLGPKMGVARRVDELRRDAQVVCGLADTQE